MKNKNEIIKAARKIFHIENAVKNPKIMNPNRDWWIGLLIGLTIFLVTAFWSANTYIENRSPGMNTDNSLVNDVVIYRASQVDAALESYRKREQMHLQLLNDNQSTNSGPIVEPVIEVEEESDTENVEDSLNEDSVTSEEDELIESSSDDSGVID